MARRRMIDPSIWQSEAFAALCPVGRLLYIGMFSQADDEGRGRARAVYLKSIIFPYEESLETREVEEALAQVAARMNITLYETGGGSYYAFPNWTDWQRVDKPQKSKIPPPPSQNSWNDSENDSENGSQNDSKNDSGLKERKGIEKKEKGGEGNRREGKSAPAKLERTNPFSRPGL